ncbi:precorrin-3B synthase [Dietzia sp. CH92]|uniref:precorrin-3B synthase n=1 Tax=Dietzia sp. CH92 TaxID=3051823 RepID=UPI0028D1CEC1|nr:precorrin-3B synthase [Dietzia sp. CH92]
MNDSAADQRPAPRGVSATADGDRARLHFPGGRLRPGDWNALAALAADHGGAVHTVDRGGLELRGDAPALARLWDDPVVTGLVAAGGPRRLPVVLASPLAGLTDGRHDLADLPDQLSAALAGHSGIDALAGRFLLGLDDGSGDVLAHSPDLAAVVDGTDGSARVHVAGRKIAVRVAVEHAAIVLSDVAAHLARSAGAADLRVPGEAHDLVVVALDSHPLTTTVTRDAGTPTIAPTTPVDVPTVGWVDTTDGLVSLLAVVAEGVIPARLAEFLGAVERPSTVSADGVIGLHGLTEAMAEQVVRVLAPMGMIFDAASPWAPRSA